LFHCNYSEDTRSSSSNNYISFLTISIYEQEYQKLVYLENKLRKYHIISSNQSKDQVEEEMKEEDKVVLNHFVIYFYCFLRVLVFMDFQIQIIHSLSRNNHQKKKKMEIWRGKRVKRRR